jgi:hypothetical protein
MITRLLFALRFWLARHIAPLPAVIVSDDLLTPVREPEMADLYSAVAITPENDKEFWAALLRYNEHYDNHLYMAMAGDDWRLGTLLQDAALSICGSPYHAGACSRLYRVLGQHDSDTWLIKFL